MTEEGYKPLTPQFRGEINDSFDRKIAELRTCDQNGIVAMQLDALRVYKNLINALPDGYPVPVRKR